MKGFTQETTGEERENARIVKSHEIAKEVCEVASTYREAMRILDGAKEEIETAMRLSTPWVRDQPQDRWGRVIKTPGKEAPGVE